MKSSPLATLLFLVLLGVTLWGILDARSDARVITRFHQIFYNASTTCRSNTWLGVDTEQNPLDVWVTQEIMFETKPDFVVECGAEFGGSAALWATILQPINPAGRVISIDIVDKMQAARALPIVQSSVTFLVGSSTSPQIFAEVERRVKGKKVLVILDSDHSKAHVLKELKLYSSLINVGGYLIAQDGNVNGNPVAIEHGPGPLEAIEEFLAGDGRFVADRGRERLLLTFHPKGYLKRVK